MASKDAICSKSGLEAALRHALSDEKLQLVEAGGLNGVNEGFQSDIKRIKVRFQDDGEANLILKMPATGLIRCGVSCILQNKRE